MKTYLPDGWGGVLKRASAGVSAEDIVAEIKRLTNGIDLPPPDSITDPKIIYYGDSGYDLYRLAATPHTILQQQSDSIFWQEIEEQVAEACSQNITLPSGARLSFELTQALTAVDVDSATSQLAPATCKACCTRDYALYSLGMLFWYYHCGYAAHGDKGYRRGARGLEILRHKRYASS